MIRAKLLVRYQFDKNEDGEPRTERWGEFDFLTLPRVDELVSVYFDESYQTVIVRSIEHSGVEVPVAHPEMQLWRKTPEIRLTSDWHWCD